MTLTVTPKIIWNSILLNYMLLFTTFGQINKQLNKYYLFNPYSN